MIIYRTFIKSYNKLVKYRKYCIFLENMVYIVNKMMAKLIEFSYRKIFQKNNFTLKSFDYQINIAFIKYYISIKCKKNKKMIFLFDLNVFNKNTKFLKKVKIPSRQTALVIISEHYCP